MVNHYVTTKLYTCIDVKSTYTEQKRFYYMYYSLHRKRPDTDTAHVYYIEILQ